MTKQSLSVSAVVSVGSVAVGTLFFAASLSLGVAPAFAQAADPDRAPVAAEAAPIDPAAGAAAPALPKAAPRHIHVLTIAAAESERARLKALAQVMPGQPIRIVTTASAGATDFAVRTAPQPAGARDAKLFTEQLHIIATPGIASIADLRGRVVSFGTEGSPGQEAARKAFQALGVGIKETPLDLDNALDGAATGDIAAVVVLAPQPFDRLKALTPSGLHLLSWPDQASLPPGTLSATIAGAQYPALAKPGDTIKTLAVDAVLSVSPRAAKQPAAKRFMSALAQHSAALSKRGFDLLKADLDGRRGRTVASNDND